MSSLPNNQDMSAVPAVSTAPRQAEDMNAVSAGAVVPRRLEEDMNTASLHKVEEGMDAVSLRTPEESLDASTDDSRLTPSQQRILGLIVERLARDGGRACCTKREIARIAKCSSKTVDRAIVRLRSEGIIESCECFNKNGSQEGNAYRLTTGWQ